MYEFTVGQKEVMLAMWDFYRLELGNSAADTITLQLGVPSNPIGLFPKATQIYRLNTNSCGVTCTLTGGKEGDVDMFMEFNQKPQFSDADSCVSISRDNNESCSLKSSHPSLLRFVCRNREHDCVDRTVETIYVGLEAYGISTAQNLVVTCSRNP